MKSLENLIRKRGHMLEHLKKAMQGECFALGVAIVPKQMWFSKLDEYCEKWSKFGISLGLIASAQSGVETLNCVNQLLFEYNYMEKNQVQESTFSINIVNSSHKRLVLQFQSEEKRAQSSYELIKPSIEKDSNKNPKFIIMQNGMELSLLEVAASLCEMLILIYNKFMDESCTQSASWKALLQADEEINSCFVKIIMDECVRAVSFIVSKELDHLHMSIEQSSTIHLN